MTSTLGEGFLRDLGFVEYMLIGLFRRGVQMG